MSKVVKLSQQISLWLKARSQPVTRIVRPVVAVWRTVAFLSRNTEFQDILLFEKALTKNAKKLPPELLAAENASRRAAFAQMYAAKTAAQGAVIATGLLGLGIWLWQNQLKEREDTLKEGEKS